MADTKQAPSAPSDGVTIPEKKKSNKTLWIVLGVVLFFFVVMPALAFGAFALWFRNKGAESVTESLIESAAGGNVDIDTKDGGFSVEGDNGEEFSFGGDQELPSDFPKDVAQYLDEKKVTFVLTNKDDADKRTWSVSTTVSKSFEDTKAHFESKIAKPEYTETSTYSVGGSTTYYGKKGTTNVTITVSKPTDEGDTNVTYIVAEE